MHVVAAFEETQKERIKNAMTEFKSELKDDFHKLDMKIEQSKSDMIKWFFAFFITLVLMILGLYATVLLK